MVTDDVHARFTHRDQLLLAALYAGDRGAIADVERLLRVTPLQVLARDMAALVEILAALPDAEVRLRSTWSRTDAALTAQLFSWVAQARLRVLRSDHGAAPPTRAQRALATMQAEVDAVPVGIGGSAARVQPAAPAGAAT